MAADFLSALVDYWAADATLAAAGVGTLHRDTAQDPPYPYAVISQTGAKELRFFGGKIAEDHYRIALYATKSADAATLGRAATAALAPIRATPLTFSDGVQTDFHAGEPVVVKTRNPGKAGIQHVFGCYLPVVAKVTKGDP